MPPHLTLVEFVRGVQEGSLVFHSVFPRYRQIKVGPAATRGAADCGVSAASIDAES
ncbi:hypothetical protein GCM10029976_066270 [Kribbella albertanoniae]